jgi:hypothetical protein
VEYYNWYNSCFDHILQIVYSNETMKPHDARGNSVENVANSIAIRVFLAKSEYNNKD